MAKQHFGNKFVGSIGWLFVGILVFIASFIILFKTEGRVDLKTVANKAVTIEEAKESKDLVYITREFESSEFLGDELFLYENEYLVVDRTVEMFSWVENVKTEDEEKIYTYDMEWVDEIPDSSEFREQRRHENPPKPYRSQRFKVNEATIGIHKIEMDELRLLPTKNLRLNEEDLIIDEYQQIINDEDYDYIYDGYGTYDDPEIGDVRIRYSVLEPLDEVTIFGRATDEKLNAHHGDDEKKLYRMFDGTNDDAMSLLHNEYKTAGWTGRIFSFIVRWIGLLLILKPLTVTLELIPVIGSLGKGALGILAFAVALILTFVSSIVFAVVQSLVGIILIVIVVAGVGYYLYTKPPTPKLKK